MPKAKTITTFSPSLTSSLTERDRRRILFVLDKQMQRAQRGIGRDLFGALKEIRVLGSMMEDPDLTRFSEPGFTLVGAHLPDRVLMVYNIVESTSLFFLQMFLAWTERSAHELAHFAVDQFWQNSIDRRAHSENLIHYAKNTNRYQSATSHRWRAGSLLDFLLLRGKALEQVDIWHYNIGELLMDTDKIKAEIVRGLAPVRAGHPYWQYST